MGIQPLIEHLQRLVDYHTQLIGYGEEKREILVSGQTERLNSITQQEIKWIKQIQQTELSLRGHVDQWMHDRGIEINGPTIHDVVSALDQIEDKRTVREWRDRLLQSVGQLQKMNRLNQSLVEQSLTFVEHTLDILTESPESELTYSKPSPNKQQPRRGFFDKKA
jgi:flagellar biosynthesis/type III secretory pathway chaperone